MSRPAFRRWPDPETLGRTVTRRTVLEWLGRATVLALGAEALAACTRAGSILPEDASGSEAVPVDAPAGGFPFEPDGDGEIYSSWPERTVDRQDLADILSAWSLRVDGLVEEPITLDFAGLTSLARADQVTDLHCVEGWSVHDIPWNGVHLSTLLSIARARETASHVTFHTLGDRYNESLPLAIALEPRTILAYGVGGSTIPVPHGFPLRLVVPRLFGYKNAKYVTRVELADRAVEGYWVGAGYPYLGEVPESRLRPGRY